jgi:hypothetical protein
LHPTDDRSVRFCDACKQNVHYCDTIEARRHALKGHCVSIDLGVGRRDGDISREVLDTLANDETAVTGLVRPPSWRVRELILIPDPVSADRQRRKQQRGEEPA